jgi:hypothetical protein
MKNRLERTARGRRAGITVVELLLASSLLAVVLGSITMIGRSTDRAYRNGAVNSHLESQISIAVQRIVTELRRAGVETIDPDPAAVGSRTMSYLQATDFEDGQVSWTSTRQLLFEYEDGELDDGVDNNGNELVDEGRLVLVTDLGLPTEHRRVLTRWVREVAEGEEANGLDDDGDGLVDEPGFQLRREGRTIVVSLSLERLDAERRPVVRTASTSVRMRN